MKKQPILAALSLVSKKRVAVVLFSVGAALVAVASGRAQAPSDVSDGTPLCGWDQPRSSG